MRGGNSACLGAETGWVLTVLGSADAFAWAFGWDGANKVMS